MDPNKLAEMQWEANVKAQIISQARVVYSSFWINSAEFDVIIEKKSIRPTAFSLPPVVYRAHVVAHHTEGGPGHGWELLLSTQRKHTIAEGMNTLLEMLYEKIVDELARKENKYTHREKYCKENDPLYVKPGTPTVNDVSHQRVLVEDDVSPQWVPVDAPLDRVPSLSLD